MSGYIKDHRQELESAVWKMPPLYHRLWQWLKYAVNYADAEIPMVDGSFVTVKRGQRLTSVRGICKEIGWWEGTTWKEPNPKTVDSILKWMTKNNMVTIERGKGNRQYTLITLVKYDFYNEIKVEGNSKVTPDGEGSKHQADINNNNKKNNKNKEVNTLSSKHDIPYSEIINYLNQKAGTNYRSSTKATQDKIRARWKEKFELDQFKTVIDKMTVKWKGTSMEQYLRPETLFGTKFESYLNAKETEEGSAQNWMKDW